MPRTSRKTVKKLKAKEESRSYAVTKVKPVSIGPYKIGQGQPLFLIAGPCVIESEESVYDHAKRLKQMTNEVGLPWIFKASYDKANRTSLKSFRGLGMKKGLSILKALKKELGIMVLSDVHSASEIDKAAEVLDVIQIPAFLCRQTDILIAAGKSKRVVNIKKGQFLAPEDMQHVVDKVRKTGNNKVVVTERGVSFGYNTLVSDMRSIPIMRGLDCPVIFDATHSVQRPGGMGTSSGGDSQYAPLLAQAAVVVGADGVFMEVHRNPKKALSDGPNSIKLDHVPHLFSKLKKVSEVSCRVD